MVASHVYAANGKSATCLNHDMQIVFTVNTVDLVPKI